jgi:hypothetical protein
MSSIQSFLRQLNPAHSLYKPPTAPAKCYYIFIAGPGNYVGNYPPGYMLAVTNPVEGPTNDYLMRDMGKTIKAPIANPDTDAPPTATAHAGFFREIQIIKPVAAVSATGSTNFGVNGSVPYTRPPGNAGDAGYDTYYLATAIDGILATDGASPTPHTAVLSVNYHAFGQQM